MTILKQTMKSKIKISSSGGSYFDSVNNDTIHFTVEKNPQGSGYEFPAGGTTIWINTSDSMGDRESLSGNTLYKHNGFSIQKREVELTVLELIREILNLPRK